MTLERDFEEKLKEAILDDVEKKARGELGPELMELAKAKWEAYASRNDYDIEHIWQDAEGPIVERNANGVTIRIEWPGLTALFEWGVSPHTIEGDPLLSFHWESPPEGTRPAGAPEHVIAEEVNWGSVTGGIPEARAIREATAETRRLL